MLLASRMFVWGMLSTFLSCRAQPPMDSQTDDIATFAAVDREAFLYWKNNDLDDDQLYRGQCLKDKPLLRHYCEQNVVSRRWPELSLQLLEGRDAKLVQVIRDEDELTEQLNAIDAELKLHPGDVDLSSLRTETAREFNKIQSQHLKLEAEVNLVNDFMKKLTTDAIVYKMVPTEDRYKSQHILLAKLNGFFASAPNPPSAPVSQPPLASPHKWTSIWTDPMNAKVYIAIATPQTRDFAIATCRGISPGKWDAIGPYYPDMREYGDLCPLSGSADDAARLSSSPLAKFLPSTIFQDGQKSVISWSRCDAAGDLPVVMRFNQAGLKPFVSDSKRRFPVVCEMIGN